MNNIIQFPSVITKTQAADNTSDRYKFVSTMEAVNVLQDNGWCPIKTAVRGRLEHTREWGKHLIEFEHPEYSQIGHGGDKVRIHLLNSHNGQSCFEIRFGLFRLVCSNGLVVSKGTCQEFYIKHLGFAPEEVQRALTAMVGKLPNVGETINLMQQTELTHDQQLQFALAAAKIKFEKKESIQINTPDLLQFRRYQDRGNSLWLVFNRVQENLMKGGIALPSSKRRRSTRLVRGIDESSRINKGLWDLALKYTEAA